MEHVRAMGTFRVLASLAAPFVVYHMTCLPTYIWTVALIGTSIVAGMVGGTLLSRMADTKHAGYGGHERSVQSH